jgi:phenylalanyl-tRNA synthetase beta subunit
MSRDFEILRPSLLPELLGAVSKNLQYRQALSFFEIGKIFFRDKEISQPKLLGAVTTRSFLELKGSLEALLDKSEGKLASRKTANGLSFTLQGEEIAKIVEVDQEILRNFEIPTPVNYAEIYLEKLEKQPVVHKYKPLPHYPPVVEDVSMFLEKETSPS